MNYLYFSFIFSIRSLDIFIFQIIDLFSHFMIKKSIFPCRSIISSIPLSEMKGLTAPFMVIPRTGAEPSLSGQTG